MDMKILQEQEMPLLSRKEVKAEYSYKNVAPTREELKKEFAKQYKADKKVVIIKKIDNDYGKHLVTIDVRIYENIDMLKKYEQNIRGKQEEEAPAEKSAPAAEDKKEEAAPAEEKPEEKPEALAEEKPATEEKKEEKAEGDQ